MYPLDRRAVGLYEKALPAEWSWDQRLCGTADAGYDYAEISIDETDERLSRLEWSQGERAALRRAIADSGVPVMTLCLSGQRRFPLGSKDPATRSRAFEIVAKSIELSVDTGVRIIQVPGYDVYFEPSDAETMARYHEGLCRVTEWAAQAGVMLALENVDVPSSASLVDAMATVRHVNSPWFQIYPDMANVAACGYDPVEELPLCKDHIIAVHVKDSRPKIIRGVPFRTGIVPLEAVFRSLAAINYRGPLTVEMWAHMDPTGKPFEAVMAARRLVNELLTLAENSTQMTQMEVD
jgi:predicted hexulose-6-phosphate isomerase